GMKRRLPGARKGACFILQRRLVLARGLCCQNGRTARSPLCTPPSAGQRDYEERREQRGGPVSAQKAPSEVRGRGRTGTQRKAFPQAAQVFEKVGYGQVSLGGALCHRTLENVTHVRAFSRGRQN